eukprot:scaffold34939_cov280-Amphora_coffeaeformis.AAC.2
MKNNSKDNEKDRLSTLEVEETAQPQPTSTADAVARVPTALESLFLPPPSSSLSSSSSSERLPKHHSLPLSHQPSDIPEESQQAGDADNLCDPLLPPDGPQRQRQDAPSPPTPSPLPPTTLGQWFRVVWAHPRNMILRGGRGILSDESRRYVRELIRRAGNYLAYTTLLIMLVVIPKVVYTGVRTDHIDVAAYNSAGVMVLGTIVLSFRLVYLHLTHWYMPEVQKYVVRILWMVPLYAVQSWLSLRFHSSRIYIDTIRDFYEAYGKLKIYGKNGTNWWLDVCNMDLMLAMVFSHLPFFNAKKTAVIASFVYYLIELLGGEEGLIHILEGKDNPALGQHTFPLSLIMETWELGEDFMLQCKHGVLQYVVFKVVATSLTLLFEFVGIYGEGQFRWMVAYPYLVTFQNVSVCYALYCLVMLYSAVDEELRHPIDWRPLGKFLCVKGVVFFCWWQGVLIFYLEAHGIISNAGSRWSAQDVAYGLIDYCIVLEMVLFAIAHSYTFTYKDYLPSNLPPEYLAQQQQQHDNTTTLDTEQGRSTGTSRTESNPQSPEDNHNADDDTMPVPTGTLQATQSGSSVTSRASYRPPATLDRPMGFTDAFWSSTLPKETIEDIQRLRVGREFVVAALRPRTASQESATRRLASATAASEHSEQVNGDEDGTESNHEDTEPPVVTENAPGPNAST